jgi:hypothetical protein
MKKIKSFFTIIKKPRRDKNIKNRQQKKKVQEFSDRFGQTSKK